MFQNKVSKKKKKKKKEEEEKKKGNKLMSLKYDYFCFLSVVCSKYILKHGSTFFFIDNQEAIYHT